MKKTHIKASAESQTPTFQSVTNHLALVNEKTNATEYAIYEILIFI